MPLIGTRAAGSSRGFGRFGGGVVLAPTTARTLLQANTGTLGSQTIYSVSFPYPGYSATIRFTLVGDGGQAGLACCGNCSSGASGENATWSYVANGTETTLTYNTAVNGDNQNDNIARVSFGSVVMNVGSFAPNCGFGDARPATTRVSTSSGPITLITSGAFARGFGRYYNDDYYYSPCGSSYGNSLNGISGYGEGRDCAQPGTVGALFIEYLNNY